MKTGQPSGSGSKMTKMWIYFKQMSFLTPHIAHRTSRSSMADSQQEKSMTSQSINRFSLVTKDSTVKIMLSSLPSNSVMSSVNVSTYLDDSITSPSLDESLSSNIATSDQQSPVTLKDCEDNDNVSEHVNNTVQKNTAADIVTENNTFQKKRVVPTLDRFAAKKQKTTDTIENILCQSSHAFNVVATAYLHRATAQEQQQQQQQHPYIIAIAEAMRRSVPDEQQLTYFMSIMQLISTYSRDK